MAVGVADADVDELRTMASVPYEETVFHVNDYDSIENIKAVLAVKLCESEGMNKEFVVTDFQSGIIFFALGTVINDSIDFPLQGS